MMPFGSELKPLMRRAPRLTLAVAESLTCGQVQARIGAVSGASDYFLGGLTAYSLEQKVRHLGVNRAHARRVNCVSQRVAVEMAQGACALFGADLAVATTGYAEPSRADGIKAPMAWWALCHRKRGGRAVIISGWVEMPGAARVAAQERVTQEVLGALVAYLRELRGQNKRV
jgi:nicotinamide-nucleotide amidase